MKKMIMGLAALVTYTAMSVAASAQSLIVASDPDSIRALASEYGVATLQRDAYGDPMIIGEYMGESYRILFYNCNAAKSGCSNVQFWKGWETSGVSLRKVNDWNMSNRFARVYVTDEAAIIEHDMEMVGGVTIDAFESVLHRWQRQVTDFESYIGWIDS